MFGFIGAALRGLGGAAVASGEAAVEMAPVAAAPIAAIEGAAIAGAGVAAAETAATTVSVGVEISALAEANIPFVNSMEGLFPPAEAISALGELPSISSLPLVDSFVGLPFTEIIPPTISPPVEATASIQPAPLAVETATPTSAEQNSTNVVSAETTDTPVQQEAKPEQSTGKETSTADQPIDKPENKIEEKETKKEEDEKKEELSQEDQEKEALLEAQIQQLMTTLSGLYRQKQQIDNSPNPNAESSTMQLFSLSLSILTIEGQIKDKVLQLRNPLKRILYVGSLIGARGVGGTMN